MQYQAEEGKVKIKFLLALFVVMTTQSCLHKGIRGKDRAYNPPPNIEKISFEEVDKNKDGKISKKEVEEYNNSEKCDTTNVKTPLLYVYILTVIVLVICGYNKIFKFLTSIFKKK